MIALAAITTGLGLGPALSQTAAQSPVGLWKTYGDDGAAAKSVVRIYEKDGEIQGSIDQLLTPNPDGTGERLCVNCKGDLKNKPMLGLVFITGLHWMGEEYGGGEIVDPASGTVYRASLKVLPDGQHLSVRGYVGLPVLGRSQTWERVP